MDYTCQGEQLSAHILVQMKRHLAPFSSLQSDSCVMCCATQGKPDTLTVSSAGEKGLTGNWERLCSCLQTHMVLSLSKWKQESYWTFFPDLHSLHGQSLRWQNEVWVQLTSCSAYEVYFMMLLFIHVAAGRHGNQCNGHYISPGIQLWTENSLEGRHTFSTDT